MLSSTDGQRLTRRSLLALGAAATLAPARLRADEPAGGRPYIDAHSHIWTRDIDRFPLAAGATLDDLQPPSFTAEELLALVQPLGIGRVVLIQHHKFHGWDNSYLIDAARRYPAALRVVGMVDDRASDPGAHMRRLLPQRVTGFRITPWVHGERWLQGDGMAAMWRTAADTGQKICCLIDPANLEEVDALCGRFPDTPVVIDHFARIGVDGEIRPGHVDLLCRLARRPKTYVKVSAFYALGRKAPPYLDLAPMIRRVLDAFGPERLMWASDSPYQLGGANTYEASLALVRERLDFLSAGDREWLLRKTAEQVYYFV